MAFATLICLLAWAVAAFTGRTDASAVSIAFGSVQALRTAAQSVIRREIDINLLMILAGAGAVAIGRYFEAATLLMLFSLSATLEAYTLGRTEKGIERLVRLRPTSALLVRDGMAVKVPVEELRPGDLVRVDPYNLVPADGIIETGGTSVDESTMTGEATPVPRGAGDEVMSGTQNLEGGITIRVTAAAQDATIDRIIRLVREARENKTSGERVSSWFGKTYTIGVVVAALVSLMVRYFWIDRSFDTAFYESLVLLVALSPCAMVISTPAAVLSALAFSTRKGILVRGGAVLEAAGKVRAVAMDKTGTLTQGRFRLIKAAVIDCAVGAIARGAQGGESPSPRNYNFDEPLDGEAECCVRLAAAIESHSSHPLANAFLEEVKRRGWEIPSATDVTVVGGMGMRGKVDGEDVRIGRTTFFKFEGCDIPAEFDAMCDSMRREGYSVVLLRWRDSVCAFALEDTLRESARDLVRGLEEVGVRCVAVLTGDSRPAALSIAGQVGIERVHAALLPGEKLEKIRELRAECGPVLMIGDGVNDAPALAAADVGIAMGGLGSDVAIGSADAVLVQDRLDRVPLLIRLGKATVRVVSQNLVISALSIVVLAALSTAGALQLGVAVLGHEGTTLVVILNGLRLMAGAAGGMRATTRPLRSSG